jgi:peptidoglycan/xylan/chitin deacetylase (PgdA/CDA1 family)
VNFIPVLLYHDLANGPVTDGFRRYVVPPSLFDEHLSAIQSAGYETAPTSQLPAYLRGELPERTAFVTFDDAYESFATLAMPALARYSMKATVFAPTAYLGGNAGWLSDLQEDARMIMSWNELTDCAGAGAEVGAHGHDHLPFDLVSKAQLVNELRASRQMLEDRLGFPVTSLAYPFGFHSRAVRRLARSCGYESAYEVGDNVQYPAGRFAAADTMLRIRRIIVDPDLSPDDLLHIMSTGRRSRAAQAARVLARPGFRVYRRARKAQLPQQ